MYMHTVPEQALKKVDYINRIVALDRRYFKLRSRLWARSKLELEKTYQVVKNRIEKEKTTISQPVGRSQGGKDD